MSDNNDRQSRPVKVIITLGAIATAILAVLTLYTFFAGPVGPPPAMRGTLSDITIENGDEGIYLNYLAEFKGFKDQTCTVELSLYDADANSRIWGPWSATEITPESNEDRASDRVLVPIEADANVYFARLELYDPDHVRLDYEDSEQFSLVTP
jgi:hypothetical protein